MTKRAAIQALKHGGLKGFISHISVRLFGQPHFLVPASSIHFRNSGLTCTKSEFDFLHALFPNLSPIEIEKSINFAKALPELLVSEKVQLDFPARWNSGRGLQIVMAAIIWIMKPTLVVETGTANGASALAIAAALNANGSGTLVSIDIVKSEASLVPEHLRRHVKFMQVDGSPGNLRRVLTAETFNKEISIFLHDADHSYLGQLSDYQIAREFNFDLIVSDDVDTSLAFVDFAGSSGAVLYDAPKFIGAIVETKELIA